MKKILAAMVLMLLVVSSFGSTQPTVVEEEKDQAVTLGFGNSGEPESFEDIGII
ncbi:hypothetical protein JV173_01795 [Acholeplasma equirhinis]|uniref:hypothetical protein n=1 Tax=Acholeplasma equirhinis TaxID=555393 RepID=UPI00197AB49F|nr:hypothetical protein [Acholeplasma equirhinis]MBN3490237.1 hypothetical protein [Acholeplasma equirhinis]